MTKTYDKLNHWYGWNGGECPVDKECEIVAIYSNGESASSNAGSFSFAHHPNNYNIIAFRILKFAPKKPREWWIDTFTGYAHDEHDSKGHPNYRLHLIHVREVLDDD